jgi:hypothetical protein
MANNDQNNDDISIPTLTPISTLAFSSDELESTPDSLELSADLVSSDSSAASRASIASISSAGN